MWCICLWLSLFFWCGLQAVELQVLENCLKQPFPFKYPLNVQVIKGDQTSQDVMLCCHGYGGNSSIVNVIDSYGLTSEHLIGFNFPDFDIYERVPKRECYGSIQELLPALHILKLLAIDSGCERISLYGFSAGGGAVINMIGVLNSADYEQTLSKNGIFPSDKQRILQALQKGIVLLDSPIKTVVGPNYLKNKLRPYDVLKRWQGLKLNVVLFIQNPDEAIPSHDNEMFVRRLRSSNAQGRTEVIVRDEGGHCGFHRSLWDAFQNMKRRIVCFQ